MLEISAKVKKENAMRPPGDSEKRKNMAELENFATKQSWMYIKVANVQDLYTIVRNLFLKEP